MTTFDKRKDAFEKKFAHDAELQFKAEARRNRHARPVGGRAPRQERRRRRSLCGEVVAADFEKAGEEDVFAKIRRDFDAAGVDQSDHQIRRTMADLMQAAIEEIKKQS